MIGIAWEYLKAQVIDPAWAFFLANMIETLALVCSVIGGIFALCQWKKGLDYKRASEVKEMVSLAIENDAIINIIDMADWQEGFTYNGAFHFTGERDHLFKDEDELFIAIDRTLEHFNHICYLYYLEVFKDFDMSCFDYEIWELCNFIEIGNYLHSFYLWSVENKVECSFKYLIKYGREKGFLEKSFGDPNSTKYKKFDLNRKKPRKSNESSDKGSKDSEVA